MNRAVPIRRRGFWQNLAAGIWQSSAPETPVYLLEELPAVAEGEFFQLVPRVAAGVHIQVRGWELIATRVGASETVRLGPWLPAETWLLNQFDGAQSLEAIARELAGTGPWTHDAARGFVREFFTRLAVMQVVVPVNCPSDGT